MFAAYPFYRITFTVSFVHYFSGGEPPKHSGPLLPRAIAKAPEGQGCPRCGGFVYAAEQMLARGRVSRIFFY